LELQLDLLCVTQLQATQSDPKAKQYPSHFSNILIVFPNKRG